MSQPVYALNLFNVSNRDEYLAYSKRSYKESVIQFAWKSE